MLTANATQEAVRTCEEARVDAYLIKPVRAQELVDKIHSLINTKSSDNAMEESSIPNTEPVLDYEQLNIDDDIEFLDHLIKIFKKNSLTAIEKINETVNSEDYTGYKTELHTLRGLSGNLGAFRLHKVVIDAEKVSHAEFLKGANKQVTQITNEIHRATKALQDYLRSLTES